MARFEEVNLMPKRTESPEEEQLRIRLARKINANPKTYEELQKESAQVWTNEEFKEQFYKVGFLAPFVFATHRKTGKEMFLMFQHLPRFYFEPIEFATMKIEKPFTLTDWAEGNCDAD